MKELSYEVDVLYAAKHESLLQVHLIIFDEADKACPILLGKFALSFWHLKNEVRN